MAVDHQKLRPSARGVLRNNDILVRRSPSLAVLDDGTVGNRDDRQTILARCAPSAMSSAERRARPKAANSCIGAPISGEAERSVTHRASECLGLRADSGGRDPCRRLGYPGRRGFEHWIMSADGASLAKDVLNAPARTRGFAFASYRHVVGDAPTSAPLPRGLTEILFGITNAEAGAIVHSVPGLLVGDLGHPVPGPKWDRRCSTCCQPWPWTLPRLGCRRTPRQAFGRWRRQR
jgi:hypothetical protein